MRKKEQVRINADTSTYPDLLGKRVRKVSGKKFPSGKEEEVPTGITEGPLRDIPYFTLEGGGIVECRRCCTVEDFETNRKVERKRARRRELIVLVQSWDRAASRNTRDNTENLSTSERQDWIDEILEIEEELGITS